MISVEQALEILRNYAPKAGVETVALEHAKHRILAETVMPKIDMPPFAASNMDGYAIKTGERDEVLSVIGESAAGRAFDGQIDAGQAVRIFTGAVMPDGADRVAIQENVQTREDTIRLKRTVKADSHIRSQGSDFRAGDTVLKAGQHLTAGDLTLAAAAGYADLTVKSKLRIAILETGDELRSVGETLYDSEIVAANGVGLATLLQDWGADVVLIRLVADNLDAIKSAIKAAENCDIIVTIGGASIGDYDLVRSAFNTAEFNEKFSKVAVKPGKPSWFATRGKQVVLGLPGNPASAFVCAHLFLRPLLGFENRAISIPITDQIEENGPRETYLRARLKIQEGQISVTPLPQQESYRLRPQSEANALIRVPPMGGPYKLGDRLDVIRITGGPEFW